MNREALFLILCSCLTAFFVYFFGKAKDHFSDSKFLSIELSDYKDRLKKRDLEVELAEQRLFDFEQSVIANLSDKSLKERTLRTQLRAPAAIHRIDYSVSILNDAKKYFQDKEFDKAKHKFKEFEEKYPYSIHLPEVLFLKAESHFLSSEFESCLEIADVMLQHYPENEFTGFLLIRMGQIFEFRKRHDEAAQVYRTVLKKFENQQLRLQAKKSLDDLEKVR